jgi:preprotein translocase subunit YajC
VPPELQFVVVLVAFLALWAVVTLPARRANREVGALQAGLEIGDEVIISAGIFGTVRAVEDDRVRLEIAEGTVITVARQAVVRRLPGPDAEGPAPETTEE